jgi:hypothetical protein
MKHVFIYFTMLYIAWGFTGKLFAVDVEYPYYKVHLPSGWDSIPADTLSEKLPQMKIDLGLYPESQVSYFSGNYVLTGFMPSYQALVNFTFQQILESITIQNQNSAISNDTMVVHLDTMIVDFDKKCVNNYFTVRKDTVIVYNCQTLYLTKFGYVTVLSYQKEGSIPLVEVQNQLSDIIRIKPDYQYKEPEKQGITTKNILFSLLIGIIIFIIISLSTKKKK